MTDPLDQACREAAADHFSREVPLRFSGRAKEWAVEVLLEHLRPLWEAQQERERRLVEALEKFLLSWDGEDFLEAKAEAEAALAVLRAYEEGKP